MLLGKISSKTAPKWKYK